MRCRFPTPPEVAGQIVSFKEVDFGYEGREQLFKNLDFGIDMQSRLAMVGANGEPYHTALYDIVTFLISMLSLCSYFLALFCKAFSH